MKSRRLFCPLCGQSNFCQITDYRDNAGEPALDADNKPFQNAIFLELQCGNCKDLLIADICLSAKAISPKEIHKHPQWHLNQV